MANNKVVLGSEVLIDLTDTTATADKVLTGYVFYGADGVKRTGTAEAGGATIIVTYDSSFYNKTMTCSNGTKTYTKTTTSSGSTEFSVSDEGIWTITCNGVSVSLDVTLNYATQMKPTGSTATPVNDIQTWLKCGGIFNKNYTTINQVLADTTTLLALISDNNAVDYMVRSTNFASSVCANATAMTDIGANNYCADTLRSDATWLNAICNSAYFESVLNVKIPTMTSNTTPRGVVSGSTVFGASYDYYKSVDGNNGTSCVLNRSVADKYWQYEFDTPVCCNKFTTQELGNTAELTVDSLFNAGTIKGSNDGTTWITLCTMSHTPTLGGVVSYNFANSQKYKYYRLADLQTTSSYYLQIGKNLQFYGRS